MEYDQVKQYFLSKEGSQLDYPFGEDVAVFKYDGKMFGLLRCDKSILNINVKCNPDDALALRDIYHSIVPGYHMNKKHWNTLIVDGRLPEDLIKAQIDQSYKLIVESVREVQHI